MRAEMLEDYETALGILDKILEEDEANSQVSTRKQHSFVRNDQAK